MRRPAAQLLWQRLSDLFPNLGNTGGFASLRAILQSGSRGEFELSYPASDGTIHLKISAGPMGDLLAVMLTDIGDVKEREASFRLLFDDNPLPMWLYDPETLRFVSVNQAAVMHYGYDRERFLTMSLFDIRPPEDWKALRDAMQPNGIPVAGDRIWRHIKANGDVIEVMNHVRPIVFQNRPAILVAITDVTERNRYAAGLKLAKELAEQASQSKTDFLATMSHEIRTPLNGILGYTDLLLDRGSINDPDRRYLERIQNSGTALLTVVNDILDFSKIEAGQIDLDPRPFSLRALIDDVVSIVSGAAEKKGLDLSGDVAVALPERLVGDESRLRQVLLNLLNNAIKFTPAGKIAVRITHEGSSAQGETIRFCVSDTGIGIPRHKQARLFERFSQVDGSIRREYGGTGLGLAISRRLVELMGGSFGVESEEGQGADFWFNVMLAETEGDSCETASPGVAQSSSAACILLVEDNEINQEIAGAVLTAAGHRVEIAADGAAAIKLIQSHPFDVVLMDIQMPGMDGLTATRHIRSLGQDARNVPIIAMTANVLPQQVQKFKEAGMDDHVGKPFKREQLLAAIERWLGESVRSPAASEDKGRGAVDLHPPASASGRFRPSPSCSQLVKPAGGPSPHVVEVALPPSRNSVEAEADVVAAGREVAFTDDDCPST
jgi:PAS domain S-box-containing protein